LSDFSACAEKEEEKIRERSIKKKNLKFPAKIDLKKCLSLQFLNLSLNLKEEEKS